MCENADLVAKVPPSAEHPRQIQSAILAAESTRNTSALRGWLTHGLRQVPLFRHIDENTLVAVVQCLKPRIYLPVAAPRLHLMRWQPASWSPSNGA